MSVNKGISREHGQAVPLAVGLMAAVVSVVFFMFNSGQLVQEKIRLTNTADAVAYSAGIYEARMLNYDAYTNRAIIANEIAIGQAVGLASWAQYASTASSNISPYMYLIPYAGPAIAQALNNVKSLVQVLLPALSAEVTAHEWAISALKVADFAVHGPNNSFALIGRQSVMTSVAQKNDPNVTVDLMPISDDFLGFTQEYTTATDRKRMGQVVSDSRDSFLVSRNWEFGIFGCFTIALKKRGSTELVDLTDGWKSMDTLSYWYPRPKWYNPCRKGERPLGYGTAFTMNNMSDYAYSYAGSRSTNPNASGIADSAYGKANYFAPPSPPTQNSGVIPNFYELSTTALKQPDPRTSLTVRVTKQNTKQRYSGGNSVVKPAGALAIYNGQQSANVSAAISRAEVYFERPDGANNVANGNGKAEIGSLFNPYWQVHLAPISAVDRAKAQLLQGLSLP